MKSTRETLHGLRPPSGVAHGLHLSDLMRPVDEASIELPHGVSRCHQPREETAGGFGRHGDGIERHRDRSRALLIPSQNRSEPLQARLGAMEGLQSVRKRDGHTNTQTKIFFSINKLTTRGPCGPFL